MAQTVENMPTMRETWVRSLGWENPLEEGMTTHSSILTWRIPMDRGTWWATVHGVAKVGHDWATELNWTKLKLCLTLCYPVDCSPPGSSVHRDSPGKNTGMGCHALLQGIFPTQGPNLLLLCLLHWKAGSLPLGPPGKPATDSGTTTKKGNWLLLRNDSL